MATQEKTTNNEVEDQRPLVLVYRLPSFNLPNTDRLKTHFRLLDQPINATVTASSSSVPALISVGPTPVYAETLDLFPSLRIVVGSSAGVDHIDLAECRRRGIAVTTAADASSENVADYAVALLLDVLRRVSAADRFVRSGLWPQKGEYPLGYKVSWLFVSSDLDFKWLDVRSDFKSIISQNLQNSNHPCLLDLYQAIYTSNIIVELKLLCIWEQI